MQILYGKPVAEKLIENINKNIEKLKSQNTLPKVALIRFGENPDDITYENVLKKKFDSFSIQYESFVYTEENEENAKNIKEKILDLNKDETIIGIMVFRAFDPMLKKYQVNEALDPKKDIDCITSYNQGKLFEKEESMYYPCTPKAVIEILDYYGVDLKSKKCTIVGASQIVGKTLGIMLLKYGATVTICNSKTRDLKSETLNADIVIAAVGKARLIKDDYLKEGQIVIDVGINFDEDGKMCGDVDFENISKDDIKITPVPKGVGMITTLTLISQIVSKKF